MHAIYLKQLASIGAPSWDKPCAARAALPTGAEHAVTHVRVFILVADMGPDQRAAASLVEESASEDNFT
eukprot:9840891-Alexandrium_andersonii.AAC.1